MSVALDQGTKSERSGRRALDGLLRVGLLEVKRVVGRANTYVLLDPLEIPAVRRCSRQSPT